MGTGVPGAEKLGRGSAKWLEDGLPGLRGNRTRFCSIAGPGRCLPAPRREVASPVGPGLGEGGTQPANCPPRSLVLQTGQEGWDRRAEGCFGIPGSWVGGFPLILLLLWVWTDKPGDHILLTDNRLCGQRLQACVRQVSLPFKRDGLALITVAAHVTGTCSVCLVLS